MIFFYRKQKLEAKLKGIQIKLEMIESWELRDLELELQREYNLVLYQEEILWYQKSREN